MSEILSREDAVRAFLDGKELEMNYKGNKGDPYGWVPFVNKEVFWDIIAGQSCDFRIVVPKAAFEEGEFAYLVSYAVAEGGRRYANAFRFERGAMFVKVTRHNGYVDDGHPGWTYDIVNSNGTPQTVHERDLRKADDLVVRRASGLRVGPSK